VESKHAAAILEEVATLMELRGENPFKVRAYQSAARSLKGLTTPLEAALESGELASTPGIGKGILETITEIITTGSLKALEQLRSEVPAGLVELLRVPGLGAKRIKTLHDLLGITGPGELEYACLENRLVELEGFGAKSQANILQGLEFLRKTRQRHYISAGLQEAKMLLPLLRDDAKVLRAEVAGSVRRHCETIGDIDLLASANPVDFEDIARRFISNATGESIENQCAGSVNSAGGYDLPSGMKVQLMLCTPAQFGMAWIQTTGSSQHLELLKTRIESMGMKLDGFDLKQNLTTFPLPDEDKAYEVIGLPWIPPELREGRDEITLSESGTLPKLVELSDLRGILHLHSNYSDGLNTLRQMAEAVMGRGWSYLGMADHSQAAAYAGGLKPDKIKEQHAEIDRLNARLVPFKIFKGIEADILGDGRVDYDDEILSSFDFVIASIHSKLKMTKEEATARILKALDNPYVRILGHPTGRLLLAREGYELDMERVLDKCAEKHIAVELNAHPYRLDLDWRYHVLARPRGVMIAICPDAHHVDGLDDMNYGIGIARKGGCEARHILNCLTTQQISDFFSRRGV
jgi:DNA polymerase (family 10)